MLQRVQTIYMVLVVMCVAVVMFLPLGSLSKEVSQIADLGVVEVTVFGTYVDLLRVEYHRNIVLTVVSILAILLPLNAIALFKRRPLQITLMIVEIILLLALSGAIVYKVSSAAKNIAGGMFEQMLKLNVLPQVMIGLAIIFSIVAVVYIRKDEKLIKDSYRFR